MQKFIKLKKSDKIAIITSSNLIHLYPATVLKKKLIKCGYNKVNLILDNPYANLLLILKSKIKKIGIIRTIFQVASKFVDYHFLQKQIKLKLKKKIDYHNLKYSHFKNHKNFFNYHLAVCFSTQKIPKNILNQTKIGFINFHPGLIPEYAGIGNFYALVDNQNNKVGFTIHYMTQKLDRGKIILKKNILFKEKNIHLINLICILLAIKDFVKLIQKNKIPMNSENIIKKINYKGWFSLSDLFKYLIR